MCKHFNTPQGCSYGDKCQFAHGAQELRLSSGTMVPQQPVQNKIQNSILNYKIVKCKNWEKDKTCKYGVHCTFAHGDEDLRNKGDNIYPPIGGGMPLIMPMVYDMSTMMIQPNQPLDFSQMQMMANQNAMMMGLIPNVNKSNNGPAADKNPDNVDKNQQ